MPPNDYNNTPLPAVTLIGATISEEVGRWHDTTTNYNECNAIGNI